MKTERTKLRNGQYASTTMIKIDTWKFAYNGLFGQIKRAWNASRGWQYKAFDLHDASGVQVPIYNNPPMMNMSDAILFAIKHALISRGKR